MTIIWILFVCSAVVLPVMALLALRWTARRGGFNDLQKTALSIFDEEEPADHMEPGEPKRERRSRS